MPASAQLPLPALLRLLAEPIRLRTLALLEQEELSVGELASVLGLSQSRVSNHLRVLREAGLLLERHEGKTTHLRSALARSEIQSPELIGRLWAELRDELDAMPEHAADRLRLTDLVASRGGSRDFFDTLAVDWDKLGTRFRSGVARERVASALLPTGLTVADLGCGTGYMARSLLGRVSRLICVDRSPGMLDEARRRLTPPPSGCEVEFREGGLDELPIEDGELDGAMLGMVLHHVEDIDLALEEVRRVIRPGGSLAVLDLAPHRETWMHEALGDRRLGLDSRDVLSALSRAGFEDLRLEDVDDEYRPLNPMQDREAALPLFLVRGRVPAAN